MIIEKLEKTSVKNTYAIISQSLKEMGIANHEMESIWLISHVLSITPQELFLFFEQALTIEQIEFLNYALQERAKHVPLAYIIKRANFFNYEFYIDQNVLIPRIETEILVQEAIKLAMQRHSNYNENSNIDKSNVDIKGKINNSIVIIDLCSGSGCVSIALARELQKISVDIKNILFVDICTNALEISKKNAILCGLEDLFESKVTDLTKNTDLEIIAEYIANTIVNEESFIIVSNPPYIPSKEIQSLSPSVAWEPRIALDGSDDGMLFYRQINILLNILLKKQHMKEQFCGLAMEIGYNQSEHVCYIFESSNNFTFNCKTIKDLEMRDRIVIVNSTV